MANLFEKLTSDVLGTSDIGKIIPMESFDKTDGYEYILDKDGEKIFFIIKSKIVEYCFTNRGILQIDSQNAVSNKKSIKRFDFAYEKLSSVNLETSGTMDLDSELKFYLGTVSFSIDVDKKQIADLKNLYKILVEISLLQNKNTTALEDGLNGLNMANEAINRSSFNNENIVVAIEELTKFNFNWCQTLRTKYNVKDFSSIYNKYSEKEE